MIEVIAYEHHGRLVCVRTDLRGKHRDHCLCYACAFFTPEDREANCPIANRVYDLCVQENLVLPVWECPRFSPRMQSTDRQPE